MSYIWNCDTVISEPPGPIDNKRICQMKNGVLTVITNSDYAQISEDMWRLLYGIYGGGPEVLLKPAAVQPQTRKTDESADVKPEPILDKWRCMIFLFIAQQVDSWFNFCLKIQLLPHIWNFHKLLRFTTYPIMPCPTLSLLYKVAPNGSRSLVLSEVWLRLLENTFL